MFLKNAIRASRGVANQQSTLFSRAMSSSATFEFPRGFKGHKIEVPDASIESNQEEMLDFFEKMVFFRRFEIVADTLYKGRQIRGFCHLYDGQEAVLLGMEAAIKPTDSVITSYRAHCHQMSRGDSGESVMGELMGKAIGCSRGKGGSMHMYNPDGNFYGGNGIVGAQVPLGVGAAFAHKYRGDGGLCVAAYGDGAANQGQIMEAANMAALWKLPVIFLCENNEFGMGTAIDRASASAQFYTRGDYIPGIWLDGMDVLASKKGFEFAADYARNHGPIFVEASTYRYHGHSMSDPGVSYRSREDVQDVKRERDCIDQVKNRILENGWADAKQLKAIEKEARKKVDACVKLAQDSGELDLHELYTDVYYKDYPPFIRAVDYEHSVHAGKQM